MSLAVIPARGGSKRISRKNIKEFCGKPIIAYSIECARASGLFERVVVSTDDAEIAEVARSYGAEVPFKRPDALSDDYSGTGEVVAHAIDEIRAAGWDPREVCCIYATAPFVTGEDIRRGLETLRGSSWDFVFSAAEYSAPVFRSFKRHSDGRLEMCYPEHFRSRSQDLPKVFHDAAQFYWGRTQAWMDRKPIFGPYSTVITLPRWRVQDIDTEEDWAMAAAMMSCDALRRATE